MKIHFKWLSPFWYSLKMSQKSATPRSSVPVAAEFAKLSV